MRNGRDSAKHSRDMNLRQKRSWRLEIGDIERLRQFSNHATHALPGVCGLSPRRNAKGSAADLINGSVLL